MRHPAVRLVPDFHAGGVVVRLPVGRVAVLIGIKVAVRVSGYQLAHGKNGPVAAFFSGRQHQFSAIRAQNGDAFWLAFSGRNSFTR